MFIVPYQQLSYHVPLYRDLAVLYLMRTCPWCSVFVTRLEKLMQPPDEKTERKTLTATSTETQTQTQTQTNTERESNSNSNSKWMPIAMIFYDDDKDGVLHQAGVSAFPTLYCYRAGKRSDVAFSPRGDDDALRQFLTKQPDV